MSGSFDRDAYIAAVKQELMDFGHSEEVATDGATSLYSIARKHPDDVDPERDAREWDIGYDASLHADEYEAAEEQCDAPAGEDPEQ